MAKDKIFTDGVKYCFRECVTRMLELGVYPAFAAKAVNLDINMS